MAIKKHTFGKYYFFSSFSYSPTIMGKKEDRLYETPPSLDFIISNDTQLLSDT